MKVTTIEVDTRFCGVIPVATYSSGYLAIWRRDLDTRAVFSSLPRLQVPSLKAAKQKIQTIYYPEKVI